MPIVRNSHVSDFEPVFAENSGRHTVAYAGRLGSLAAGPIGAKSASVDLSPLCVGAHS